MATLKVNPEKRLTASITKIILKVLNYISILIKFCNIFDALHLRPFNCMYFDIIVIYCLMFIYGN